MQNCNDNIIVGDYFFYILIHILHNGENKFDDFAHLFYLYIIIMYKLLIIIIPVYILHCNDLFVVLHRQGYR